MILELHHFMNLEDFYDTRNNDTRRKTWLIIQFFSIEKFDLKLSFFLNDIKSSIFPSNYFLLFLITHSIFIFIISKFIFLIYPF